MEEKIVFEEKVFQSKQGAYEVFKARCMGEECFCITPMNNCVAVLTPQNVKIKE